MWSCTFMIYTTSTPSPTITLFESLAAKAALVEYKQGLITKDEAPMPIQMGNIQLPEKENMNHEVFISYSRKDKDIADYVSELLKENGIRYWIDREGIYSRSNYKELRVDAIDVAKAVIFISSENSNSSINVIREIGYAVNMNKPILPLILDEAQYAKSIRLDISDIDQIDFKKPVASSKKLITSLMYVLNK